MEAKRGATLRDVAARAGVHVGTASRALDPKQVHLVSADARARIRVAAEELGYRPNGVARTLRRGASETIGVVFPDLSNAYVIPILRGIEQELGRNEYLPLITETLDDHALLDALTTRLLRQRVDAIILGAARLGDRAFVDQLAQRVPVVLAVRGFLDEPANVPEVVHDDTLGGRLAAQHLLSLGHRRVAQLAGAADIAPFAARAAGFSSEVLAAPTGQEVSATARAIEPSAAEGRRIAAELLSRAPSERPTALFAHSDLLAVGALDAISDAGLRCPEDVSVVGYNDAPLSDHLQPPLTTVRLPGFDLGRHSARAALSLVRGEQPEERRLSLAPQFVQRRSTAPPPVS